MMNGEEQTAYIIHHLTEGDEPKDIILELCEQANLSWPQAEALVKRVQEEKAVEITRKQFPLLFTLALAIFLGGLGLIGYSLYYLTHPLFEGYTGTSMSVINYSAYLMQVIINSRGSVIYALLIGTGMILGSLFGMRDVWSQILNK
jgi:hypothetical protein